jgi:hypothetical protein
MADQILRRDKNSTTDRTGKALWVQLAGQPTGSTYDDEWILPEDFLAPEQADIATNAANISSNTARITTLEEINKVQKNLNLNTSTTFALPQNGVIREINITAVSGSGIIVRVGTTLGGGELADYSDVDDQLNAGEFKVKDLVYRNTVGGGNSASQTIYITVSNGTIHSHIYYKILSTT